MARPSSSRAALPPERRSYQQFCGVARALDFVGERWTLLIVRNLLLGPRRYGDLLAELPGLTTNLLAKRLRELEIMGLVEKQERPPPVASTVYALTADGAALESVIMSLGAWGGRFMDRPHEGDRVDIGWALLSMKRRYRGGATLVVELVIDERAFELRFEPTYLRVQERPCDVAEVSVKGTTKAFHALLFQGKSAAALRERKALVVTGREAAWARFVGAFEGVVP